MFWLSSIKEDGSRHVTPIDDLRPHTMTMEFWCRPFLDGEVIVHNSIDLREQYERGERKAS